jgi:hypothetical protein
MKTESKWEFQGPKQQPDLDGQTYYSIISDRDIIGFFYPYSKLSESEATEIVSNMVSSHNDFDSNQALQKRVEELEEALKSLSFLVKAAGYDLWNEHSGANQLLTK